MLRLLLLISVLLGLASAGPSLASVAATGSFWTGANQEVCRNVQEPGRSAEAYELCAKKINAHAGPCQQLSAVLPRIGSVLTKQQVAIFATLSDEAVSGMGKEGRFRPPQLRELAGAL